MRARPDHDRSVLTKYVLDWAMNLVIVAVLPVRIGILGAPLWFFLAYAIIAGLVAMLAEDLRYARLMFARADIRDYLTVRIAIVAVLGIAPFLAGHLLA